MTSTPASRGMRSFLILWIGQFVSGIGVGLGSFTLGVWIYQTTGSATRFGLQAATTGLTMLLLTPVAGVLADRMDRKKLLILAEVGSGLTTLAMAALLFTGRMEPWHVYPIVILMVGFSAFQGPALFSSVTLLVPREQLARASGMTQTSRAIRQIIGPILAGVLIGRIGYHGVILLDCATFFFALGTILLVRIPQPARREAEAGPSPGLAPERVRRSILGDLAYGWTYLRERPGLFALLSLYALTNFCMGMVQVLLTPLILSFATPVELGTVNSSGAAGILLGGLLLAVWGGPRRRVQAIFAILAFQALILFLGGVQPSVPLIALASFTFMLTLPLINGCNQVILQRKVAPEVQGRVFSMAGTITAIALPVSAVLAGPLADRVFEPLLMPGGALADTFVGHLIGVGPGRGVGLLFIVLGMTVLAIVSLAFLNRRLRGLDSDLTDAVPDTPGSGTPKDEARLETA